MGFNPTMGDELRVSRASPKIAVVDLLTLSLG
jgi:hypothetical protein